MSTRNDLARPQSSMMTAYATIAGIIAWFALILQLYLTIQTSLDRGLTLWVGIARFFGYFTILTNILVAIAYTLPLVASRSSWGRFFAQPVVRTAIALYITLVGLGYWLLLRNVWDPQGWQLVADNLLHYVNPILYVLFWFLFVPKGTIRWGNLPPWLIYPLVYVTVALIRGAIFKWYPYPFLEVDKFGYPQVLLNVAMLFVGFCVIGAIFIAIARFTQRNAQTGGIGID